MSYTKTVYVDNTAPPLNVTNLNNMESGVESLESRATSKVQNTAGFVDFFATNDGTNGTAPTGWLVCDGSQVSRATYSYLFSVIGITFGAGNGETTFNVPDLRACFIRGWDDRSTGGVDNGRVFGSYQDSDIKSHNHTYTDDLYYFYWGNPNNGSLQRPPCSMGSVPSDTDYSPAAGTDGKPKNYALIACIKF